MSRIAEARTIAKKIIQEQEIYKLSHGHYADNFVELNPDIIGNIKPENNMQWVSRPNLYFSLRHNKGEQFQLSQADEFFVTVTFNRGYNLYYHNKPRGLTGRCYGFQPFGHKVCEKLTGEKHNGNDSQTYYADRDL
ncbi:MAG: hypothetical protein LBG46_00150 [Elusimicrobiota bacterium]|jgi:hypothetical protein|nr:hypothetical protein [Elusimicrobiota bacterium]